MKIAIVLGTRPEIIKMSPVIRECQKRGVSFILIHSNQHYTAELDRVFFDQLNLPNPDYNLNVGSQSHALMTASILEKIEPILISEQPDWVLVQGDTNTVLAGALAASKIDGIRIGHIEAGLRSYDRSMPEEINRVVVDHVSDLLFAPTQNQADILLSEAIDKEKIIITGNTVVDAVQQNLDLANQLDLTLPEFPYYLLTMHRPANVDTRERLESFLSAIHNVSQKFSTKVIFPIHPRTQASMDRLSIHSADYPNIKFIDPLGYLEMLRYMAEAEVILTDSGGVQEEACILGVPCLTLRNNTERPETVKVGASEIVDNNELKMIKALEDFSKSNHNWINPFGDGTAANKILTPISPH